METFCPFSLEPNEFVITMKLLPLSDLQLFAIVVLVVTIASARAATDFAPIFDGKSLDGWDGDPRFWRVEAGTIVGETTANHRTERNTFLIWKGGEVADFELIV